jgi:glycosyltransferase involved in cell wall biosynthesis
MKIALIGPGIMPIPPPGWGAVEILIWDYYQELTRLGHTVDIINQMRNSSHEQMFTDSPYCQQLIQHINQGEYDFVHIHYDCLYHIMSSLTCKKVGITSHYPYIDQIEKHWQDGYHAPFRGICSNKTHFIFALSKKDYDIFQLYSEKPTHVFLLLNGSNHHDIIPIPLEEKSKKEKSIYLGKIEERKQQYKYTSLQQIDFYGRCDDMRFKQLECYKGELIHRLIMNELVHYGNMVLLSTGENGTPLVIKEALMAGLPIVINKHSANDLDITLPFIDVIPDDKLNDLPYIQDIINKNRSKQTWQSKIREYAVSQFSWEKLVSDYICCLLNINIYL